MSLVGFNDLEQNQFGGWDETPLPQGRLKPTQLSNSYWRLAQARSNIEFFKRGAADETGTC